jgi:hypothetical protein
MNMTHELRCALINGEAYGFPSVADAPIEFQNRIAELRFATLGKRKQYANGHGTVVASASTDADTLRQRLKLAGDEIRKQAAEQKKADRKKIEDRELCPTCGKPIEDDEDLDNIEDDENDDRRD